MSFSSICAIYVLSTGYWGVGIPFLVPAVSFTVTWLLYRHFSKQL